MPYKDPEKRREARRRARRRKGIQPRVLLTAEENREKNRIWQRDWRQRNPEKRRIQDHVKRAKRRAAKGRFTASEWLSLKAQYGNKCLCCGRTETELASLGLKLVPDHIKPLAEEGYNLITNIQPLCHGKGGCNDHKGRKHVDYRSGFPIPYETVSEVAKFKPVSIPTEHAE